MQKKILILDLDGVLITTPPWKADEIDTDGYSKFNPKCIENLNCLLNQHSFEIYLSSTRRKAKRIEEFNIIFQRRNINTHIKGYVPNYINGLSRLEEINQFLDENNIQYFLVIDDDKSLNNLSVERKKCLISTNQLTGFNKEKLNEALEKLQL